MPSTTAFFFRKIAAGNAPYNPSWNEVATRGANSFTGNQTISGQLNVTNSFYTSTGVIYVRPQNSTAEGGEIRLLGAGSNNTWYVDNAGGRLRMHHGGISYFDLAANGNLGLGTHTPDYKLDVNGAVRAKEFFVETGWSDFVFEKDYELPTLEEVEEHIEEHGHLPGVPSAAEIQENGLEMGQAQTFLMQKIEELTLYVLEISEENAALREDSSELRERIHSLESKLQNK